MHLRAALAALFLLWALPAFAQTPVTVNASSAQMVAGQIRTTLSICNQSSTATISVCFADTTGSCTAALNTAGQYLIPSTMCMKWYAEDRPPGVAIYGISSAATTPVTVTQR